MSLRTTALLLPLLGTLAACSPRTAPTEPAAALLLPGEPWLRTDRSEYVVRVENGSYAVDFDLTYTNHLNEAVAVPACHSPFRPLLEKRVGEEWVLAFAPVELMCITAPLVIGPGRTHAFRYEVRGGQPGGSVWPQFETTEIEGTYRLVWFVGSHDPRADNGIGAPLPPEQRTSAPFTLRR